MDFVYFLLLLRLGRQDIFSSIIFFFFFCSIFVSFSVCLRALSYLDSAPIKSCMRLLLCGCCRCCRSPPDCIMKRIPLAWHNDARAHRGQAERNYTRLSYVNEFTHACIQIFNFHALKFENLAMIGSMPDTCEVVSHKKLKIYIGGKNQEYSLVRVY